MALHRRNDVVLLQIGCQIDDALLDRGAAVSLQYFGKSTRCSARNAVSSAGAADS
jgi:hypothetical protein